MTEPKQGTGESRKTVGIAIGANAAIAIAKLIGGLASGSSAMLAEAGHSLADTTNQLFMLLSLHLASRGATEERPFGQGAQRYLWTFLAAVGMFVAGAFFAVGYGVYELLAGGEGAGSAGVAWGVLALSAVAEAISWTRALRQTRGEARAAGLPLLAHLRESRDPNVKMVLLEDSAALLGLVLAALGLGLREITGRPAWDAGASIVIGLLLVAVAVAIARDSSAFLIGAPATRRERRQIEDVIRGFDEVHDVVELLTLVLGPGALLVAARIDLADGIGADRIERVSSEIDHRLHEAVPDVAQVFLDATARTA